jgi:hypothetical protein
MDPIPTSTNVDSKLANTATAPPKSGPPAFGAQLKGGPPVFGKSANTAPPAQPAFGNNKTVPSYTLTEQ